MNTYQKSTLALYREYASKLAGHLAEQMNRVEQLEHAARRILKAVGDCESEADAVRLFEGARLLGIQGQDKEAFDSIIALWELVKDSGGTSALPKEGE